MKNKKLLGAIPLLILAYLGGPAALTALDKWGYDREALGRKVIVGHRGGASIGVENTLSCFQKGIATGADMMETDIHLTRDRQIVVCHDQTIDRTTNGKGKIRDMTLAEIRKYQVVDGDGKATGEVLPTIDDILTLFQKKRAEGSRCRLLIEIKRTHNIYKGIERILLQKIAEHHAKEWVVVQSFNDFALEEIHRLDPTVRVEKLFFMKLPGLPLIIDGTHVSYFSYRKYGYVSSFNAYYLCLTKSLLNDIHRHGKEVKVWTLEGPKAPQMDVDGIITNRPDLWCKLRQQDK